MNSVAETLIRTIREAVIGDDRLVDGAFGARPIVYVDYTASGRALAFIEDFIREQVLPLYGNTHTEASLTARRMTRLREDARRIIAREVGADARDAVIFCGAGMTGAIDRLISVLGLRLPAELDRRHGLRARIPPAERAVVFIGPYEHHSNELPWRETLAEVVVIGQDDKGGVDLDELENELLRFADRSVKIGSFSAASNVTGILTDADRVTAALHRHGALAFWDYAAAGPYVSLDMNPPGTGSDDSLLAKDAMLLSPHKFVGGPGTPGVLVIKRALLTNPVPSVPGGGTVTYVGPVDHRYLEQGEEREEGGTPAIVESIRAGLVFQLKAAVGADTIKRLEDDFLRRAVAAWTANPNLRILGSTTADRLAIVSFLVRHGRLYLHHDFVVAVLDDLFGIQARGGCACAGPYGHRLLGIDPARSRAFEKAAVAGYCGLKPGWVRLGFNYFFSESQFAYVVAAVDLVAEHGWKLLPQYRFDPATGRWLHRHARPPDAGLETVSYASGRMAYPTRAPTPALPLEAYLETARSILAEATSEATVPSTTPIPFPDLRWFPMCGTEGRAGSGSLEETQATPR